MSKLIGGLSGFWKFVMAELFFDDAGHHFAKSGIHLDLHGGGTAHLWFDCKIVVADEAALHGLLSCKGSSGLKCCCMCANIFNWKIDRGCIARDRSGTARYHTTHDFDSLVLHTPSSIDTIFRSLGAAAASELAELETRLGWKWELHSAMVDPAFRRQINPCASVTFDGMHCFFVNGVFNHAAGKLIKRLKELKIMTEIEEFVNLWKCPRQLSNRISIQEVFSPDRIKSSLAAGTLKCSASEGVSIVPILAQYCLIVLRRLPGIREHLECFLALALAIGRWQRAPRRLCTPRMLKDAIVDFLKKFFDLYGPESMTIKFHYILHMPLQFDRLINCWVHERKHKHIKRYGDVHANTSGDWDKGVLRDVTCDHISRLQSLPIADFSGDAHLVEPLAPSKRMLQAFRAAFGEHRPADEFMTSKAARVNKYREMVVVNDVVMWNTAGGSVDIGKVLWHASVASEVVTCVEKYAIQSEEQRCLKCTSSFGESALVTTRSILCALTYAGAEDETMTMLKPLHCFRSDTI